MFSFSELCAAKAHMSSDASVLPLSGAPLGLVLLQEEARRACWLALCNVALAWRMLPVSWAIVPVVPVPKPGRDQSRVESNHQISLLESLFKLLDALVHARVGSRV